MKLSKWIEGEIARKVAEVIEVLEGIIKEEASGRYMNGVSRQKQQLPVQSLQ